MVRRLFSGFALNSLRTQLLLWIALPVAVSLFGISLLEIRGHEQTMEGMVQKQADLLALSIGGLTDAHIDQHQAILFRLADEWSTGRTLSESYVMAFDTGLVFYDADGEPIEVRKASAWQLLPVVQDLVQQVETTHTPSMVTVEDADGGDWLLVQAIPVTTADGSPVPASVLAGAVSVRKLAAPNLYTALGSEIVTELRLTNEAGDSLVLLEPAPGGVVSPNKVVTAEATIAPTGWRVFVREEWEDLVPPILHFSNASFVIIGAAVVISFLSAFFGLRSIVQPLRRLDAAASQVSWGNFEAIQQPVGGVAEIEELRLALARMTEQIRLYQKELQSYIGAMTRGQEEERRRLARELHDETVQDLIALTQQVELVEREMGSNPEKATARLQEVRPLLSDSIAGLRRQIHNLRPIYLEDLGFVPALEMLVRQISDRHNLIGDFDVSGETAYRLAPTVEISAFRIVQEALQNVVVHTQARWVHVELIFMETGITLRIEDDGKGFAVPTHPYVLAQQGHFGLLGMKERAQLLGGKLHIESEVGRGTTVIAVLPALDPGEPAPDGTDDRG